MPGALIMANTVYIIKPVSGFPGNLLHVGDSSWPFGQSGVPSQTCVRLIHTRRPSGHIHSPESHLNVGGAAKTEETESCKHKMMF